jgi:hypothetical protein
MHTMKHSRRRGIKKKWFPNPKGSMPGWREYGKWDDGYWPEDADAMDTEEMTHVYEKQWKLVGRVQDDCDHEAQ